MADDKDTTQITESVKFIYEYGTDYDNLKEIAIQAIDYLNKLDSVSKVFKDQNAFNAICFICQIMIVNEKFELFDSKNCTALFIKFFKYFDKIKNELILNDENLNFSYDLHSIEKMDMKRGNLFLALLLGTNLYTMSSKSFCIAFSKNGGLKYWLKFLKDKTFLMKNKDTHVQINPINIILLSISNLSRFYEDDSEVWIQSDIIDFLLEMSRLKDSFKSNSYSSIIYIADDKQFETLPEIKSIKLFIIDRLEKIAKEFETRSWNRSTTQMTIKLTIKGEILNCENHHYNEITENTEFSSIYHLKLLYKLSINKKMGNELYYDNNLMKHLKSILLNGNYFEIYFSLEIIAQLTFDEKIASDMKNNIVFKDFLEKFNQENEEKITSEDEKKAYNGVKKLLEQINWNLKEKFTKSETKNSSKHIMISYNTASRPLCLKIKQKLEALEFGHVWMDVTDLHGSSLDSMANGVENASCVLMCVTEKYRQSIYCKAEAQYAFQLNKTIIPVIMQTSYKPQGWLGIIMNVNNHVNIKKICLTILLILIISD